MPFVKIHREKQLADAVRSYQIYVDGEPKGEIRRGAAEDFFVTQGVHRIFLKIDWCGSREIEFSAAAEETVEFDCGNNTKSFFALYYVFNQAERLPLAQTKITEVGAQLCRETFQFYL